MGDQEIDLRAGGDLEEVGVALDALGTELNALWASALERGDFDEVTRIVRASHAVHLAALAVQADSLIPKRSG